MSQALLDAFLKDVRAAAPTFSEETNSLGGLVAHLRDTAASPARTVRSRVQPSRACAPRWI